jgi:hypothetical protein
MESTSISTIVGLLVLGGVSAGTWCYMDLDSKRSEEREVRRALKNLKETYEVKKHALDEASLKKSTLQDAIDSKEALKTAIAALQSDKEAVVSDYVDAVKAVRTKSIGSGMPELLLPSGLTLQKVVLQKVGESGITLAHTGGVTKLVPAELPEHIRQKFRLGVFPMTSDAAIQSALPAATASTSKGAPAPAATATPQSPPPLSPSDQSASDAARVNAHLSLEISDLESKISLLNDSKAAWKARADACLAQASSAQISGKPSYGYASQAATANKNIETINSQIFQLQYQITTLRKKQVDVKYQR